MLTRLLRTAFPTWLITPMFFLAPTLLEAQGGRGGPRADSTRGSLSPLQSQAVALENDYVRVTRDGAPCASATTQGCGDRVIVALSDVELRTGDSRRTLTRGDIAVFTAGQSYQPPTGGGYFEVAIKVNHPPVVSPSAFIPPEKNAVLYDGERLFIFEERLEVGDTRERHSHSQRVVIQLNRTRLQQWPEGESEIIRDIVPDRAAFNPPVIHTVKNVGDVPLRGIVIELRGKRATPPSK